MLDFLLVCLLLCACVLTRAYLQRGLKGGERLVPLALLEADATQGNPAGRREGLELEGKLEDLAGGGGAALVYADLAERQKVPARGMDESRHKRGKRKSVNERATK